MKAAESPARDRYHHGDLRNALLETALRLIADRGPEGFSLREAAREVGVSPGAAYRHFADKDALLTQVASDGHGRLATAMEKAMARVPGVPGGAARAAACLVAIGEAYVDFALRHPSHFRVMFGPCVASEGFVPACAPSGRDAFEILVDVLDELVASGAIEARARAGAEIPAWSVVHGLAGLLVDGAIPLQGRARVEAVRLAARTVLLGLGCDPRAAPGPAAPFPLDSRPPAARTRPPRR